MLGRIIASQQKPMAEITDRHFLRPRQLLSAPSVDFADAINLVIYAAHPLRSNLTGRSLVAGYVGYDEQGSLGKIKTFAAGTDLLRRYANQIDRLTFPVAPSTYELLLDQMWHSGELVLPYFFHEHHLVVDRRRRSALFQREYNDLQSIISRNNAQLQASGQRLETTLFLGTEMTNKALKNYLYDRGVLSWWEDETNLSSHACLERVSLHDALQRSVVPRPIEDAIALRSLPPAFSARWTKQATTSAVGASQAPVFEAEPGQTEGLTLFTLDHCLPSVSEPYDENQAPSFLLAKKFLQHPRYIAHSQTANTIDEPKFLEGARNKAELKPDLGVKALGAADASKEPPRHGRGGGNVHASHSNVDVAKTSSIEELSVPREISMQQVAVHPSEDAVGNEPLRKLRHEAAPPDEMLTREETGKVLGKSANTVDNYTRKYPDFPKPHRITKKRSRSAVEAWLQVHIDDI